MLTIAERNTLLTAIRRAGADGPRGRAFVELDRLRAQLDDAVARVREMNVLAAGADDLEAADDLLTLARAQYATHVGLMQLHGWLARTVRVSDGGDPEGFVAEARRDEMDYWNELVDTASAAQRERFDMEVWS